MTHQRGLRACHCHFADEKPISSILNILDQSANSAPTWGQMWQWALATERASHGLTGRCVHQLNRNVCDWPEGSSMNSLHPVFTGIQEHMKAISISWIAHIYEYGSYMHWFVCWWIGWLTVLSKLPYTLSKRISNSNAVCHFISQNSSVSHNSALNISFGVVWGHDRVVGWQSCCQLLSHLGLKNKHLGQDQKSV